LFALRIHVWGGLRLLRIIEIGACIHHQIIVLGSQDAAVVPLDEICPLWRSNHA